MKRSGILLCLVGPAAGGKTTAGQHLLQRFGGSLALSVSLTSRPMRPGEIDGQSYYFVSREEFQRRVESGELFEWEEIHGNLYGTLRSTVETALAAGNDLLFDVDIRGALKFKRRFPSSTVICFIVPPSFQALKERLLARSQVAEEEYRRRISTTREEYRAFLDQVEHEQLIDYFVVNDQLEPTKQAVEAIVLAERARVARLELAGMGRCCRVEE